MMAGDELATQFVGGTVYQAFLSALSYHRWHAPVSGTIKKAFVVDGTFFSEKISAAIINTNDAEQSKLGLTSSQSYIAHMATRFVLSSALACTSCTGTTNVVAQSYHLHGGRQPGYWSHVLCRYRHGRSQHL